MEKKQEKKKRFSWTGSGGKKDLAGVIAQVDKLYTD